MSEISRKYRVNFRKHDQKVRVRELDKGNHVLRELYIDALTFLVPSYTFAKGLNFYMEGEGVLKETSEKGKFVITDG